MPECTIYAMDFPAEELRRWFLQNRRPLPWRENATAYSVWISEVMLQQTVASVVTSYFERWMAQFPTIEALASASLEAVIKQWEGLGYYSRARFLHEGAKQIVTLGGVFPNDEKALLNIKGIGAYTCGAILSFAFHQKKAAVDGNVLRTLARFFAIEECIDNGVARKKIELITQAILPDEKPWEVMEGLIECGALVCQKDPKCYACPLQKTCMAHRLGMQKKLPLKKERPKITTLYRFVGVIESEKGFLVKKGTQGKVMGELYEFPYVTLESNETEVENKRALEKLLGISLNKVKDLPSLSHSFTRYKAHLFPVIFKGEPQEIPGFIWERDLLKLPFSSGHRKIVTKL